MNARIASFFEVALRRAVDQARAGQRDDVVDVEDDRILARQLQLDGLVVREARRRVDGALLDGDALAEVGVLDDRHVVRRQAGRARAVPGA